MPQQNRRISITLVGSGNLAQALGPALRKAGYAIDTVVARSNEDSRRRASRLARRIGARVQTIEEFEPKSKLIWLLHTDDALEETAKVLAKSETWKGRLVFHSSGALTSDVLAPLKHAGAFAASLHPMMTFVHGSAPDIEGVPFAVEGDRQAIAVAKQIARALRGQIFTIRKENKVLYHALGSFSSPMLVAALVTAERVGQAAGLSPGQTRNVMRPILEQTLKNYFSRGAAAAFSGPIKRGDLETIRRHLRELERVPEAKDVYRALVRSALSDLPASRKEDLLALL